MINPEFSIIIPLHVINDRFFTDLKKFQNMSYKNYEIIIVTDHIITNINDKKIKIISTGLKNTGPAEKRDIALTHSKGKYISFIDDDAYPSINWLSEVRNTFKKYKNIVAVGGSGITPKEDSYLSQIGGLVYESLATSGKAQHRFINEGKKTIYVEDWPAYNLTIKKDVLNKVNGYGCTFYGGEDTFLCLKLIKVGPILYNPKAFIFHHRRKIIRSHLKQIYNIGLHRGYFFKKFPETSRKLFYLFPMLLTFGVIILLSFSIFSNFGLKLFLSLLIIFYLIGILSIIKKSGIVNSLLVSLMIILTHITYGIGFFKGLLKDNLLR